MSFPSSSGTIPTILPVQTITGITYTFGRVQFAVVNNGGNFEGRCRVGIQDSQGFRIETVKASGADLFSCAVNLTALIAEFI